jgi:hypothetical protein
MAFFERMSCTHDGLALSGRAIPRRCDVVDQRAVRLSDSAQPIPEYGTLPARGGADRPEGSKSPPECNLALRQRRCAGITVKLAAADGHRRNDGLCRRPPSRLSGSTSRRRLQVIEPAPDDFASRKGDELPSLAHDEAPGKARRAHFVPPVSEVEVRL